MNMFLDDDFLLSTKTASALYHEIAAPLPIVDYHCHLPVEDIACDRQFNNLAEIWLESDHYKWRALRTAGVDEHLITGDADDFDKYMAWANTVPQCIGNPLYHWTHLELRRPFGLEGTLLGPDTAERVWQHCNELLPTPEFSARGILRQMRVQMVGTTDDPLDNLDHHRQIAADSTIDVTVLPTWRPDSVFKIEDPGFVDYIDSLAQTVGVDIRRFSDLHDALAARLDYFAEYDCRSADHGVDRVRFVDVPAKDVLDRILAKRLDGVALDALQAAQFDTAVQVWLGREYSRRGWVMQLHVGAQRNNNSKMLASLGPNAGFDSIGDRCIAEPLAMFLDLLARDDCLPRTILYCLNPRDNEMIATMTGNFQGGGVPGKIQFGTAWWFNDQNDGIRRQLTCLTQMGLLSRFVGMVTDSRSFLSYIRHEYFRRIFCDLLGTWVESGEIPANDEMLERVVSDVCCRNAQSYFAVSARTPHQRTIGPLER